MWTALIGPIANIAGSWMDGKVEQTKANAKTKVAKAAAEAAIMEKKATGEIDWDRGAANTTSLGNTKSVSGYANYSFGPVTVGVQQNYTSGTVSSTGVHNQANEVTIMGIAFNVNDNLSISYEEYENEYLKSASAATGATAGQADVTQEADGIQIAYTMGGATLRISDVSVDNSGGTAGNSEDRTEVSLLMAF